jgi:hypothetical protein
MENLSASVEVFFRRFELNNNKNDFSAAVSQFADTFMAAGPQGAQCVRASDFALALPKRKQLFESFGCHSMQLIRVDAHSLGERYSMAYTRWKMNFAKGDLSTDPVFVDSTFIVETNEQQSRIVLYLAHQDVTAILTERGPTKA